MQTVIDLNDWMAISNAPTNWGPSIGGYTFPFFNCVSQDYYGLLSAADSILRTFSLGTHQQLQISFQVYFVDVWFPTEKFNAKVDGNVVLSAPLNGLGSVNDCNSNSIYDYGEVNFEYMLNPSLLFDHSALTATVKFAIEDIEDDAGGGAYRWAIRNLQINEIDCISKCLTCSGPAAGQCLTCATGYYLWGGSCFLSCPDGTFHTGSYVCNPCDSSCATCSGTATACTGCNAGTYLQESDSTCVACNLPGQFINGLYCSLCDPSCYTCSGTATTCTGCNAGMYLRTTDNACVACNVPKFYIDDPYCKPCHSTCETCDGDLETNCLSCPTTPTQTYFLPSDRSCTACDADGWSPMGTNCVECDSNCKKCSTTSTCTACYSGLYLLLDDHTCVSCTTPGMFQNGVYCSHCDANCATCSGTATTCTGCNAGTYLRDSDKTCVACNVPGQFINGLYCSLCDPSCYTCSGTATTCTGCNAGMYLRTTDNACVACNVPKFYIDDPYCKPCHSTCETCDGDLETNCLSCPTTPTQTYFLPSDRSCTACDADGWSPIGTNCVECNSNCKRCSNTINTCTACYSGLYLLLDDNTCVLCNTPGMFQNGVYCSHCDANCVTCSGTATHCTSCATGLKISSENYSCVNCNVPKYYISGNYCRPCDITCETCDGDSNNHCKSCPTTPTPTYFLSSDRSCTACDADGWSPIGTNCTQCDPNCRRCSNTINTCTACYSGEFLLLDDDTCVLCNTPGMFEDGQLCSHCDTNCVTCEGTAAHCTSCATGLKISSDNYTCVDCDVIHYYINGIYCKLCNSDCETCSGDFATDCLTCPANKYLVFGNHSCTDCVEDGYSPIGPDCVKCADNCLTCIDTDDDKCLTCKSGYFHFSEGSSSTGNCILCDEDGLFQDGITCKKCHTSCKRCTGTGNMNCTDCYSTFFLYATNNSCVECVIDGYFQDGIHCKDCHSTCKTCTGTTEEDCTSCYLSSVYPYFYETNHTCLECDADGYWRDEGDANFYRCKDCHDDCRRCTGPNEDDCSKCWDNKYLMPNNTCMDCNFDNFWKDGENCSPCASTCRICIGALETNCQACHVPSSNQYFITENTSCSNCILNKYYPDGLNCSKCDVSCLTCNGPAGTNCLTCMPGSYLLEDDSTCGTCNPIGYFIDGGNCRKCDSSCLTCLGNLPTNCLTCNSGFYFMPHNSSCSVICSEITGFYIEGFQCLRCDISCADCLYGGTQDCIGCASGYYRNGYDITCVQFCPFPLITDTVNVKCSYVNTLGDFTSYFDSNLGYTTTSTQSRNIPRLIESQAAEMASYISSNVASTGCPECSGHGSCSFDQYYEAQKCNCNKGYSTTNCSLDTNSLSQLNSTAMELLSFIKSQLYGMRLTVNATGTQSYLNGILSVVSNPYLMTNDMATSAIEIVNELVKYDMENKSPTDVFDPAKLQTALQVVDACLTFINKNDCLFSLKSSQKTFNSSLDIINNLGVLQVYGKEAGDDQYVLNSTNLYLGSKRVTSTSNLTIVFGENPPTIAQFSNPGLPAGVSVDLQLQYWKTDLSKCPKYQDSSLPPSITISVNEVDTLKNSSYSTGFSVKLWYPGRSPQNYDACLTGCTPVSDTWNGTTYFICDCASLSVLGAANAFLNVFANSNLAKLMDASALLNYDYISSWAFWLLMFETLWFLVSHLVIHFDIITTLKYKVPKEGEISLKRFRIQGNPIKVVLLAFWVMISLFSPFSYLIS